MLINRKDLGFDRDEETPSGKHRLQKFKVTKTCDGSKAFSPISRFDVTANLCARGCSSHSKLGWRLVTIHRVGRRTAKQAKHAGCLRLSPPSSIYPMKHPWTQCVSYFAIKQGSRGEASALPFPASLVVPTFISVMWSLCRLYKRRPIDRVILERPLIVLFLWEPLRGFDILHMMQFVHGLWREILSVHSEPSPLAQPILCSSDLV